MAKTFSALVVFALALLGLPAPGQAQTEKASLQAELLKDWGGLKEMVHGIADAMPAEKYGFKPTEGQQTFGERVMHIAGANVYFLGLLGGTAAKPAFDNKATGKDAALKALDASFDYGAAVLKEQTDQTLLEVVASSPKFLGPSSKARLITFLMGHTWDIYGQLAVYLRLNGVVPPASRKM